MSDTKLTVCFEELCELENVNQEWIVEIVEYNIAKPISGSTKNEWVFDTSSVIWLKKAVRIYTELEIDWVAVAIIIDLQKQNQMLVEENLSIRNQLDRFHAPD